MLRDSGDKENVIGSNSSEEDKGIRSDEGGERNTCGGKRWPRQETLALLKIRLDMDEVFRESSLKAPLWEQVSRKLVEIGYNQSAKKCKEKFENVYKYHKRTKEGRTGNSDGKTYKFFDQLQALENKPQPSRAMTPALPWTHLTTPSVSTSTVPSTTNPTIPQLSNPIIPTLQAPKPVIPRNLLSGSSTSSSTASDEDLKGRRCKRRMKWKDFFKSIAMEVIEKQEELQLKFLETIEKQDNERMGREEAWRIQEMERMNREHEILVQERSTAAAQDAAVIAFLQSISGQHQQTHDNINTTLQSKPMLRLPQPPQFSETKFENNSTTPSPISSSRWPKAEVEALIGLRTNLDRKYHENGAKGPLWEDISAGMHKLGYNRNAKRCKEKWENINKYFKRVKESSKKRPEDSKTCPYFHQLDALYKEKNKIDDNMKSNNPMEALMVQPEQQWPPQEDNQQPETVIEDIENRENGEQNQEEGEDVNSEEEDDDGGGYEMVINKPSSIDNVTLNEKR